MIKNDITSVSTFGELKQAGIKTRSIKQELRGNLIKLLQEKKNGFEGIHGFEDTVIPELQTAILSRHNILLLGLRGQAKTRLARMMVNLLDEYIPYIAGSELNDDPYAPISWFGRDAIKTLGDATPIAWLHRDERYTEKLATPDVTVADLIGDADPIKAATLKLPYSDERVIHYGLIARAHRGIFVINELPDLQARIQVSLFNILQEADVQIRGFRLRLPLDIQFVFTANPEDYTNRGSIVTPLKDRIESQILTHYPRSINVSSQITQQEANLTQNQRDQIIVPQLLRDLIEQVAFEARASEFIDKKSGVSARLTISAYENLVSSAERRLIINNESKTWARIGDFLGIIPSITGKIELVYEGELEGPAKVASNLIGKAIKTILPTLFPDPEKSKKGKEKNAYNTITAWFADGNRLELQETLSKDTYEKALLSVPGLKAMIEKTFGKESKDQQFLLMEFLLHGLAEYSMLSKNFLDTGFEFGDMFQSLFNSQIDEDDLGQDSDRY